MAHAGAQFEAAKHEISGQFQQQSKLRALEPMVNECFRVCVNPPLSVLGNRQSACLGRCFKKFQKAQDLVNKEMRKEK